MYQDDMHPGGVYGYSNLNHLDARSLDRQLELLRCKKDMIIREQQLLNMKSEVMNRKRQHGQTNPNVSNMFTCEAWESPPSKRFNNPPVGHPRMNLLRPPCAPVMSNPRSTNYIPPLLTKKLDPPIPAIFKPIVHPILKNCLVPRFRPPLITQKNERYTHILKKKSQDPPNRLNSYPIMQRKNLVSKAMGMQFPENSASNRFRDLKSANMILREDEVPSKQVVGRLELALGKICKEIREKHCKDSIFEKLLSSPWQRRAMKQGVRDRLRGIMLDQPVGSFEEIVRKYRQRYSTQSDIELLDSLLKSDRPKHVTVIQTEDPKEFFDRNIPFFFEKKLKEMSLNLLELYKKKSLKTSSSCADTSNSDVNKKLDEESILNNKEAMKVIRSLTSKYVTIEENNILTKYYTKLIEDIIEEKVAEYLPRCSEHFLKIFDLDLQFKAVKNIAAKKLNVMNKKKARALQKSGSKETLAKEIFDDEIIVINDNDYTPITATDTQEEMVIGNNDSQEGIHTENNDSQKETHTVTATQEEMLIENNDAQEGIHNENNDSQKETHTETATQEEMLIENNDAQEGIHNENSDTQKETHTATATQEEMLIENNDAQEGIHSATATQEEMLIENNDAQEGIRPATATQEMLIENNDAQGETYIENKESQNKTLPATTIQDKEGTSIENCDSQKARLPETSAQDGILIKNNDSQKDKLTATVKADKAVVFSNIEPTMISTIKSQSPSNLETRVTVSIPVAKELPYCIKLIGQPRLPNRDVLRGFLDSYHPNSIKKHKSINNLLVIGFDNKERYDKILEASETTFGDTTIILKASGKVNPVQEKASIMLDAKIETQGEKDNGIKTEPDTDESQDEINIKNEQCLDRDNDLIGKELDDQITDFLSTIREEEIDESKKVPSLGKAKEGEVEINNEETSESVKADKRSKIDNEETSESVKADKISKVDNEETSESVKADKRSKVDNEETSESGKADKKSKVNGRCATPVRSSSRLVTNLTPSTIRTRRSSRLIQE